MKLPKIAKGSIVKVNWLDIITEPSWTDKNKFQEMEPIECITVGVWMLPGETCIRLATNINENSCDGTIIPKGCIIGIEIVQAVDEDVD